MKQFTLSVFCWILLASCMHADTPAQEVAEIAPQEPPADFRTLDVALPFSGFWVNERYVRDLRAGGSPLEAQGPDESCILIPDRTLQTTRMVWGFHDGGPDLVVVKNANGYELWDSSFDHMSWPVTVLSENSIRIGEKTFIRLHSVDHRDPDDRLTILEELLFSGSYRDEAGGRVVFTAEGTVEGLEGMKEYEPVLDYSDAAMDVDQLSFLSGSGEKAKWGYTFINDTLRLFTLRCLEKSSTGENCEVVDFDELKHTLVKQKN